MATTPPIILLDETALLTFARQFGKTLLAGTVIYLQGELGVGKTTFCRGILQAYGFTSAVKSPTYTLVEPYQLGKQTINHFDLYRLGDPQELEFIGIREYFSSNQICLIEWPERGGDFLPNPDIIVFLQHCKDQGRVISLEHCSQLGNKIIQNNTSQFPLDKP